MGRLPSELLETMTEGEFQQMVRYAERHMLPTRRLAKQMAVIAQVLAGGAVEDFLILHREPAPAEEAATVAAAQISSFTGSGIVVLGSKRRKVE